MKKLRLLLLFVLCAAVLGAFAACGAPGLSKPQNLKIANKVLSWDAVDNARGYTVDINGVFHDVRRTSYSFEGTELAEGTYTFRVKARGNDVDFADSDWATVKYVQGYESGIVYKLNSTGSAYVVASVGKAKGDIVIEDTYNGLPVVEVADFAFLNNLDVTSVVIGKNVTKIGSRAFYGCTAMTSVEIPDGVYYIGDLAFQSCHSLTNVVIPDSVLMLAEFAFAYCRGLTDVTLSQNLLIMGESVFKKCEALTSINIPESVISIGNEAFISCSALEEVKILPHSLSIGTSVFRSCTALKSVDFGDCKMTISARMFNDCTSLEKVELPDSITAIGDYGFYGCTALNEVDLGKYVTSIGAYAFYNTAIVNNSKSRIQIVDDWVVSASKTADDPVTDDDMDAIRDKDIVGIADYAFRECTVLRSIRLPNKVKYIGTGAFAQCNGLYYVTIGSNTISIGNYAFYSCPNILTMALGPNVETIGLYAFRDCTSLTRDGITMYNKVTSIGTYAFYNTALWTECVDELKLAYVGNWLVGCPTEMMLWATVADGTVGIADYAFAFCKELISVFLPSSIKYMGIGVFYGCTGALMSTGDGFTSAFRVDMPDDIAIDEIPDYTFFSSGLYGFKMPSSIKKIGDSAFGGTSLESIEIPDSVTQIGEDAFWACKQLQTVTLSQNITEIPAGMFNSCTKLKSIEIPSKVTAIGEKAFFRCNALSSVTFNGDYVESIGDKAFYMCSSLTGIDLPENVTEIGDYAFYKSALVSVGMNSSLQKIGEYAFFGCQKLKSISLPGSLTHIGNSAFRYCTSLSSLVLGRNVAEIGAHAFFGDIHLTLYSESAALPKGWDNRWNSSYRPVVFGCSFDPTFTYVESVQKTDSSLYNYFVEGGMKNPKRAGYTFVGWATTPNATEAEYTTDKLYTAPNGTLYTVWKEGAEPDEEYNDPDLWPNEEDWMDWELDGWGSGGGDGDGEGEGGYEYLD